MPQAIYKKQPDDRIPDDLTRPGVGALLRDSMIAKDRALRRFQDDSDSSVTITTISGFPDALDYFYLPGRSGGQIAYGGQAASEALRLRSTSHATKGIIYFGAANTSVYDEANNRWGMGIPTPSELLHVGGAMRAQSIGVAGPAPSARFLAFYNTAVSEGISIAAPSVGLTSYGIILPTAAGAAGSLLQHPGGGTGQLAWVTPSFVTTSAESTLASERVLTGTANQIVVTDNGAGSTVVLNTPQNLHTSAVFQVGTLGVGAAVTAGFELGITGDAIVSGRAAYTPGATTLSADTDAWTAPTTVWQRVTPSGGNRVIGGIDSTGSTHGQFHWFVNVGPFNITLENQEASAAAADRILSSTGADLELSANQLAIIQRDTTTNRWRAWKYVTPGNETITGDWNFNGAVTVVHGAGGLLVLQGTSAGPIQPHILLVDGTSSYTQTIYGTEDTADGSLYGLPAMNGASDLFVMRELTQAVLNKELAVSCFGAVNTSSSGFSLRDSGDTSKQLRAILSGAVGNNSVTINSTAARDYATPNEGGQFPIVGSTAVTAGNAAAAHVPAKYDITGRNTDIASTTLVNTPTAGVWLINYYLECTTGDATAGPITFTYNFTDDIGATTRTDTRVLTATGRTSGQFTIYSTTASQTFTIAVTGAYNAAVYAAHIRATYLG